MKKNRIHHRGTESTEQTEDREEGLSPVTTLLFLVTTLCVLASHPVGADAEDAERRKPAFPRGAWERELLCICHSLCSLCLCGESSFPFPLARKSQ